MGPTTCYDGVSSSGDLCEFDGKQETYGVKLFVIQQPRRIKAPFMPTYLFILAKAERHEANFGFVSFLVLLRRV